MKLLKHSVIPAHQVDMLAAVIFVDQAKELSKLPFRPASGPALREFEMDVHDRMAGKRL